jgi:hypothetical protein
MRQKGLVGITIITAKHQKGSKKTVEKTGYTKFDLFFDRKSGTK